MRIRQASPQTHNSLALRTRSRGIEHSTRRVAGLSRSQEDAAPRCRSQIRCECIGSRVTYSPVSGALPRNFRASLDIGATSLALYAGRDEAKGEDARGGEGASKQTRRPKAHTAPGSETQSRSSGRLSHSGRSPRIGSSPFMAGDRRMSPGSRIMAGRGAAIPK
jgi:hypothetical protein